LNSLNANEIILKARTSNDHQNQLNFLLAFWCFVS
jgi:hypothetical protein